MLEYADVTKSFETVCSIYLLAQTSSFLIGPEDYVLFLLDALDVPRHE